MATRGFTHGTSPAVANSYIADDGWVRTDGAATFPNGNVMANGQRSILITGIQCFVSGRGGNTTVSVQIGGIRSANWTTTSAGAAVSSGMRDVSSLAAGGGSSYVQINASRSIYFGRASGSGQTYRDSGSTWAGGLVGSFEYAGAPSAMATPSVAVLSGEQVRVSFTGPSDNGGAGIQGYFIQYSKSSNFGSGVTTVSASGSPWTISNLDPGADYYFRVSSRNAVTQAAGTQAAWSGVRSVSLPSGGKAWVGGKWKQVSLRARVGTAWKVARLKAYVNNAWKEAK